jgi:hypothetical protein
MEPAGIEPATSCLQIRTTGSSAVATPDQTGDPGDEDPDLARPFAVICRKCLPPACPLSLRPRAEMDARSRVAAAAQTHRSRRPVWAFSPSGVRIPPSPLDTVDPQHWPGTWPFAGRYDSSLPRVNAGQLRPYWAVRASPRPSPHGRLDDLTGAVSDARGKGPVGLRTTDRRMPISDPEVSR